ncbi:MAG: DUF892 family protein [Thermoleophilaceae bacterium]
MPETLDQQLTKYLTDAHSIEVQALQQLRTAPKLAGDEQLASAFARHYDETLVHERRVRERLEARDAAPSKVKDVAGRVGGIGMLLFARVQPDTPGKLVAHAYSYEHMELATYDLLGLVATRAGDDETAAVAESIRAEEGAMADRLGDSFDRAVEASLAKVWKDEDLAEHLIDYLADVHAIEGQSIELLDKGARITGDSDLAKAFTDHLDETRSQRSAIAARLEAHEASPSRFKDAAMRVGGLNLGAFFGAQPDTPAKLAGFAFAFEHLEVAAYEELMRVAARAGDDETARIAGRIAGEERAAAAAVRAQFPSAVDATLEAQRVAPRH